MCQKGSKIDGKPTHIVYDTKDDIGFVIIEIGDYHNQFYIIPKQEMIDHNVFASENSKGQQDMLIPPPDYKGDVNKLKNGWIFKYLDRWDLLE